jgi:hypothetical protein
MRCRENPTFRVRIRSIEPQIEGIPYAVSVCPRCGTHIAINPGMMAGIESSICKGKLCDGRICNGHYYLDLREENQLEFVGTV